MWAIVIVIITTILLSRCSGHCLAKTENRSALLGLRCHLAGIFFPPKWPSAVFTAGLPCPHATALYDSLGSEVPDQALCDSSLRPSPVLRRAEGDRQGQQNLPKLQRPLHGLRGWGVGAAGKSVMDQQQITLTPWIPLSARSLLTFSKAYLAAPTVPFIYANVFMHFCFFQVNSMISHKWRKRVYPHLEVLTTTWSCKHCSVLGVFVFRSPVNLGLKLLQVTWNLECFACLLKFCLKAIIPARK